MLYQQRRRLLKSLSKPSNFLGLALFVTCSICTTNPIHCFSIQNAPPTTTTRKTTTTTTIFPIHHRAPCTRIYNENIQANTETNTNTDKNDVTNTLITPSNAEKIVYNSDNDDLFISNLCQGTNEFMKSTIIEPVRNYVEIRPAGTAGSGILEKLTAPPEVPGIPRPVWLTILGSVPTALGWYGYYKFSIEEELYQHELQTTNRVSGCGGYGTLFPFVWCILIGFPLSFLGLDIGASIVQAGVIWILLGQINLYRRVNELCSETMMGDDGVEAVGMGGGEAADELMGGVLDNEPPLHAWWALLPPPLDVVVGLRQVHFLSEYWRITRGEEYEKDVVAEQLFPFISAKRFTLKEFFRTPSMWFWFTTEWKDFDYEFLKEEVVANN